MIKISIYQNNKKILGGITNIEENKVKEIIDSERPMITTIDSTSTDAQIPSAKSVYDKSKNKIKVLTDKDILAYADSITSESVTDTVRILNGTNTPYGTDNTINDFYYTIYNIADHDGFKRIVAYDIRQNDMYMIVKSNGTWSAWKRVCTTKVADVEQTTITTLSSYVTSGSIYYQVKNGVCYVSIIALVIGTDATTNFILCSGLPKCASKPHHIITDGSANVTSGFLGLVYVSVNGELGINLNRAGTGYCSFSYPVAES